MDCASQTETAMVGHSMKPFLTALLLTSVMPKLIETFTASYDLKMHH